MTWLKLTSKALYLMDGENALEKADLQPRSNPVERSLNLPLNWFQGSNAPNGMVIALKTLSEPIVTKSPLTKSPIFKPTGETGLQLRAPSGVVFDIFDAAKSTDSRLKQFNPMQKLSMGLPLPRYYLAIRKAEEFNQPLTDNFVLSEFISDTERSNGIQFPYFVPVAIVRTAQALEDLRAKLGNQSLRISSGYRSPFYPDYRKQPGRTSAHRFGTAVDIGGVGGKNSSIAMMKMVDIAAFGNAVSPGKRPSGNSAIGFEYSESLGEMNNQPDHSHLDMGYVTGEAELKHLGSMLITL
jgi:Peptidase M15